MEKELASFIEIESQIEHLADLVVKLKEENQKLKEDNEQLERKYQSISTGKSGAIKPNNNVDSSSDTVEFTGENKKAIELKIKNALNQLEQLHQLVDNNNVK